MALDITNISRLTFGVNFLGGNGAEEVNTLWNSRFAAREAFLVTADPQTNPNEIFDQFCQMLNQQEQTHMVGKECMLTFFVDYTAQLPKTAELAIWGMRNVMENKLGCKVQAVIQFAYVGRRGDHAAVQRENVRKALENNGKKQAHENYRLILVGKSVLMSSDDYSWKAPVIFLDLLRRCKAVEDYLPTTSAGGRNDFGFLRYGEFNRARYEKLQSEVKRLSDQLVDVNQDSLRLLVEDQRKKLIEQLESRYPIDGIMHPQHPDMIIPEKTGWFGPNLRREAEKGKNQAYNNAVKATRAAVEKTGSNIRKEVAEEIDRYVKQASQTLEQFFKDSKAGIMLKIDPVQMQSVLYMQPYPVPSAMPKLVFKYSEQGVQNEIQEYLEYTKADCIAEGLKKYSQALQKAYEDFPRYKLMEEKNALEKERDYNVKRLEETHSAESFCRDIELNDPSESIFEVTNDMDVDNRKFLLCRSAYTDLLDSIMTTGHFVDDQMSGIVKFDDAPVKAVMVVSVNCTNEVLDHFLPEVGDSFEF